MRIRDYQQTDERLLAKLYEETVRRWAPALYTPAQVDAWAAVPHDQQRFYDLLNEARTFVALDASGVPIGFAGIDPNNRVASLYVDANHTRQGIGTALLRHVIGYAEANCRDSLWSEASLLSRPVFERHGFTTTEEEVVLFNGIEFKRWIVRRPFP